MRTNGRDTWVVVADASSCRVYEYHRKPEEINLLAKFDGIFREMFLSFLFLLQPETQSKPSLILLISLGISLGLF